MRSPAVMLIMTSADEPDGSVIVCVIGSKQKGAQPISGDWLRPVGRALFNCPSILHILLVYVNPPGVSRFADIDAMFVFDNNDG
jgi:hypothetical protein